ncbi:hypothetical protein DVH24_037989 [Malus domestica]|uniref:TATA-box-binding protein n=1 Tax=Malus domestica TaxID=3750 RepID=A0A498KD25_MALDO|nr:hypothetical protein DVH24_037989 [Malus domestica]
MEAQGFNQYRVNKTKGVSEEGSHPVVDLSKHPSGIVPTLQNIVSTVNLDCKLDLKAIALKARNSEYNPKACDVLSIASPAPFLLYFSTFLLFKSYNVFSTVDPSLRLTNGSQFSSNFIYLDARVATTPIYAYKNRFSLFKVIFILHTNYFVPLQRFAAVIMRIREPKTTALIFASGKMVCTGAKSEEQSRLAARKYARVIQKLGFPAKFQDFKIQNIVGSCDVKFPIRLEGLHVSSHGVFSTYEPEIFPGLIYRMKQPKIVLLICVWKNCPNRSEVLCFIIFVHYLESIVISMIQARIETYEAFENIYPVLTGFRKNQHCLVM